MPAFKIRQRIFWELERGHKARTCVFVLILAFYGSLLLHKIDLPAADDLPRHIQNGATLLQGTPTFSIKMCMPTQKGTILSPTTIG